MDDLLAKAQWLQNPPASFSSTANLNYRWHSLYRTVRSNQDVALVIRDATGVALALHPKKIVA